MDNKELIMFLLMNIMSADDDYIESNEIEILGEDVNGVEGFCTYKITDAAKLAYDEITTLRQQVKDMEWISVDDRLPEQGGCYLATEDDCDICIAMYYEHNENWRELQSLGPFKATHWMPLPKPPMKQHNEGKE